MDGAAIRFTIIAQAFVPGQGADRALSPTIPALGPSTILATAATAVVQNRGGVRWPGRLRRPRGSLGRTDGGRRPRVATGVCGRWGRLPDCRSWSGGRKGW
jgi:hypothetical protein